MLLEVFMVCLWEEAITAASGDNWPHEGGTGMYSMSAVSLGPLRH